jgi:hypothetical protein
MTVGRTAPKEVLINVVVTFTGTSDHNKTLKDEDFMNGLEKFIMACLSILLKTV